MKVYVVVKDTGGWQCNTAENVKVFDEEQKAWNWIGERTHSCNYDVEIWEVE